MIELEDILIRQVELTDAEPLFRLINSNRDRLAKYLPITLKENASPELTGNYLSRIVNAAKNRTTFTCVIVDKASETFAGIIIIKKIDWHASDCELGYFICQEFEGQGITSRAVAAVCDHCFGKLNIRKISLFIGPENTGSVRVAEKNGFLKTGSMPGGHRGIDGEPIDVDRYERRAVGPLLGSPRESASR
jgi:RimJ/RimL family protein N-acetyltransferase